MKQEHHSKGAHEGQLRYNRRCLSGAGRCIRSSGSGLQMPQADVYHAVPMIMVPNPVVANDLMTAMIWSFYGVHNRRHR